MVPMTHETSAVSFGLGADGKRPPLYVTIASRDALVGARARENTRSPHGRSSHLARRGNALALPVARLQA